MHDAKATGPPALPTDAIIRYRRAAALASIRSTGADALGEMRRVVAMLRDDSDGPLHPQPGLDGLTALAEDPLLAPVEPPAVVIKTWDEARSLLRRNSVDERTVDIITKVTEEYHLQFAADPTRAAPPQPRQSPSRRSGEGDIHERRSTGHRAA